ncbi:hypothetical protein LCGC14_1700840 [marine sediment metagenome]|uniref:Uncharacterized protein n=1 Tax=marine sediment metagenome TaxID=412755 RepID=A0A0F9KI04_9ZZZZ
MLNIAAVETSPSETVYVNPLIYKNPLAVPYNHNWEEAPASKTILITGAAGSFGHHFIEHVLVSTNWNIAALVRMGKIGNLQRLTEPKKTYEGWMNGRLRTVWHGFLQNGHSLLPFLCAELVCRESQARDWSLCRFRFRKKTPFLCTTRRFVWK